MIISLIIGIIVTFLGVIFQFFPVISELPLGIDAILTSMVSYYHGAILTVPYLQVVFDCFLYAIGFELFLIVLKFFLGSRVPSNHPTN